jgi:hypothetical protein
MFTDLFEFVYTKFLQYTTLNHLLVCSRLVLTGKPPGAKRRIAAEHVRGKGNGGRTDLFKFQVLRIEKVLTNWREHAQESHGGMLPASWVS